ncbi:mitochondrial import inner membrane translocase subunit TIM14 isoform X1 [Cimex lectularius]|uniref:J domain-containing protein n=1 Tax=Cimex lectularius TaxID=79782 RepID=A0A8I6RZL9_CIMLE|nr:mitochondrial import inner membrane translocase subunit TIM14 isoform X1 [Cimex lectularius]
MTAGIIVAGLGLAALGFIGKYALKAAPAMSQKMADAVKSFPKMDAQSFAGSKYYKGGFDSKMSKREASLILGISPSANKLKIKEAHKRIMALNHPDRGGSPYIAAKINEAKDHLESNK